MDKEREFLKLRSFFLSCSIDIYKYIAVAGDLMGKYSGTCYIES